MTVHMMLEAPEPEALLARLEAGDTILDLCLFDSPELIRRHAMRAAGLALRWHEAPLLTQARYDRAREAIVAGLAELPLRRLASGGTWRESFLDARGDSLWWSMRLNERMIRSYAPLQLIYRQWWLERDGGSAWLKGHLGREEPAGVVLWTSQPQTARLWVAEMARLGVVITEVVAAQSGERLDVERLERRALSPLERAVRRLGALRRHVAVQHELELARRRHAPRLRPSSSEARYDLAIVTFATDWSYDEQGVAKHLYFQPVADHAARRGLRVAWLPVGLSPEVIEELYEQVATQPLPVLWEALEVSVEDINGINRELKAAREELDTCQGQLRRDQALELFGLPLGELLVEELGDVIDLEALKFGLLRLIIERASSRARVLLYRNEFYRLGRAISTARSQGAHKWAMQHGTISEDHWTYLYDRRDFLGRGALPRPDRFLVYGEYTASLMRRWGAPPGMLWPLGSLRHDWGFKAPTPPLPRGVPRSRPVVTLCLQLMAQIPAWIERLVLALEQLKEAVHVAVKPHPRFPASALISKTFEALQWRDYSVHSEGLDELLVHSAAVLTENSTTGFDALLWGTPLICLNEAGRYEAFPYVSHGGALPGASVEALVEALRRVLDPSERAALAEARSRFLRHHLANTSRSAFETFDEALDRVKLRCGNR